MLIRFHGRTAARGVGQAIAHSLAGGSAYVFACDLDEVVPIVGCLNGVVEIIAAKVDVTDETSIAEVVREAGGTTDIFICVAGGVRRQKRRSRPASWRPARLRAAVKRLVARVLCSRQQHRHAPHGRSMQ
jgi:NAD(P)-dependent dehydrogenase (short-subunit alcohol dehydrogenase family)